MRYTMLMRCIMLSAYGSAAAVETHCGEGEKVFFSCAIEGSTKLVSLCGGVSEYGSPLWLQYRFGRVGDAELIFPSHPVDSLKSFGGIDQSVKGMDATILEVWFRIGAYDYLIQHVSGEDCDGACQEENDVVVFEHGRAIATLACNPPVINELGLLYGYISDNQSSRP